ncbi:ACP phosphodiesterase [Erwinia sp. OLTSP20]|uniref:ACP phosphodiesterase n=1 Tax=unclassified Erwinia TaxID=2622719 RepID=UPI000C1A69FA|nr:MULTISPECIES: ACP phosphodiesterase [unclassified Erwinia]PIJ52258.1 ACP phosphodiesterase [Erwinia sp. OAMSP11]PIJ75699.1 ACP phosphodiesterase [Erwinia sp. OLSSP12]PIJ83660.1 ACP phosphodiesterase [Erwinia sp. OLMTSP26]PIJ84265.1 ACP phosphodiesterase [Erwinia sp. OLCASP19]PIJ88730.1 ACP phosphodiesterase [Erwinia sp. OLMDSP33]
MNFLAHLHLASLANSSLLGNLMADFVRGDPWQSWPPAVAAGITLHRRIDVLTDGLAEVKAMRRLFRPATRRVAPVTLDVVWDHFLSLHWDRLVAQQTLPAFLRQAESEITPCLAQTPQAFQDLNRYLWQENWMQRYSEREYLQQVFNGMANRRPRLSALRDSWQDFCDNYGELEQAFWQFYPRMMASARLGQL